MLASNATLGSILVDGKGMTLYTFVNDTANTSNCSGGCATAWPPLTVPQGTTPTAGAGVAGKLGVIQRADGSDQVTIDSKPLYYYAQDAKPGDVNGQGLNSAWYAVQIPAAY
jgi:predicted lipoprotein with Yx(FWY)xxD motif